MSRSGVLRFRLTIRNNVPTMNNNNNNNNQNPMMQMRDRLFQVMFVRLAIGYAKVFPHFLRSTVENFILCFAMLSLFLLAYVHVTFVHEPMNCLDSVQKDWPHDGILRIEIVPKSRQDSYSLQNSYDREVRLRQYQGYNPPYYGDVENTEEEPRKDLPKIDEEKPASDSDILNENDMDILVKESFLLPSSDLSSWLQGEKGNATELGNRWSRKKKEEYSWPIYIVEYSLEYGFLKLSLGARKRLNIPVKLVTLDPEIDVCFGSRFTKFILENLLGYDDVLLASLSKLASREENKGFIRNVVTEHYFRFVNVMSHSSYLIAAVIMMSFTFFISTLLRYSHHQIFVFIIQILRLFELRATTSLPVASLMTVILSLVGMEAIMSEFFNDPTTSFYVILVVWIADQFDSICCRTAISRRHWLRFFYLYHFAFYAYDYRFSGQYSDLALFTTCCFIFHSMVYFFHHYELPVILRSLEEHNNPDHHHNHHHHHQDVAGAQDTGEQLERNVVSGLEINLLREERDQPSDQPPTELSTAGSSRRHDQESDRPPSSSNPLRRSRSFESATWRCRCRCSVRPDGEGPSETATRTSNGAQAEDSFTNSLSATPTSQSEPPKLTELCRQKFESSHDNGDQTRSSD